jgi:hypothetical protein
MEYIDGTDAAELLKPDGPLTSDLAIDLAAGAGRRARSRMAQAAHHPPRRQARKHDRVGEARTSALTRPQARRRPSLPLG